jgi:hypothetical protein
MATGEVLASKLRGIIGNLFHLGGFSGPNIKNNSGVVEARNAADSAYVLLRGSGVPSSGEVVNDIPRLLDLQGRIAQIDFSFDGASAPSAGSNTGDFGFCHTTGGGHTAGDVIYDDGSSLITIPASVVKHITTTSAVSGTISLIANGVYSNDGGTWTLKGDGTGAASGSVLTIEVTYSNTDTAGKSSTTSVPNGARVLRVRNIVETIFNNSPTVTVIVDGTSDETILTTTDSDLETQGEYHRDDTHLITSSTEGVITVTVGGTPSAGAGRIIVEYATPQA